MKNVDGNDQDEEDDDSSHRQDEDDDYREVGPPIVLSSQQTTTLSNGLPQHQHQRQQRTRGLPSFCHRLSFSRIIWLAGWLVGLFVLLDFTEVIRIPSTLTLSVETKTSPVRYHNGRPPSRNVTVYHIGQDAPFGRNNNRLIAILHATDYVFEFHHHRHPYRRRRRHNTTTTSSSSSSSSCGSSSSSPVSSSSNHERGEATVAVWGWASKVLREFFGSDDSRNKISWPIQLECMFLLERKMMEERIVKGTDGDDDEGLGKTHHSKGIVESSNITTEHCGQLKDETMMTSEEHVYVRLPILIHGTRLSAWDLDHQSSTSRNDDQIKHIRLNTKETYTDRLVGNLGDERDERVESCETLDDSSTDKNQSTHFQSLNRPLAYPHAQPSSRFLSSNIVEQRRRHVLRTLFRYVPGTHLSEYRALQSYLLLHNNNQTEKKHYDKGKLPNSHDLGQETNLHVPYIAIHTRWLEGQCEDFVGPNLPHDECYMTPQYIQRLIASVQQNNEEYLVSETTPIVVIGDGQRPQILKDLLEDTELGLRIVAVPDNLTTSSSNSASLWGQPVSDMMVAIMSDLFIGTRASTMATMIGQVRVVLNDADPSTNLVYVYEETGAGNNDNNNTDNVVDQQPKNSTSNHSTLQVCGECIFWCNKTQTHICGSIDLHN